MEDNVKDYGINLPEDVRYIINTIESNGFQAYAVGGCVRDSVLGRVPDDWDITTSAQPMQTKSMFKKTVDTGIKHGTVTVMMGKNGYEVTTYRIDGEYKDGRHPESVEFSVSLTDDLKRRDFTINAMAYNEARGLVDEFDGLLDLENRIIRCVGDAKERFTEDALRMMRAIRFSAQLMFDIDKETYVAIEKLAKNINKVSMERVQVELAKTLMSDNPDYVVRYYETGLFKDILPDIEEVLSSKYATNALTMLKCTEKTAVHRYAALLNTLEPERAKVTLKALKLDNYTIDNVVKLISCSKVSIEENEPAVRTAIHKYGAEFMKLLFAHMRAIVDTKEEITGISMSALRKHQKVIEQMYQEIVSRGDCVSVKDLDITGNDLIELGLKGAKIGETLNELLDIVLENPKLNDKETLIAMIKM